MRTLTDFFAQTALFLIQALELRDDDKKRLLGKGVGLGESLTVLQCLRLKNPRPIRCFEGCCQHQ